MKSSRKKEEIIRFMASSEVALEAGFRLIVSKCRALDFFEAFEANKFLQPDKKYQQIDENGRITAPFWPTLIYLEQLVKEINDQDISSVMGERVLNVLCEALNAQVKNYRNSFKLIEIVAGVKGSLITNKILNGVAINLNDEIDNSISLSVFVNNLLPAVINRKDLRSGIFSCIKNIYAPVESYEPDISVEKRFFRADSYWHKLLSEKYAYQLASLVGKEYIEELIPYLEQVFPSSPPTIPSWLVRPAIEDHTQNKDWHASENILIISIRDGLLSLCDQNLIATKDIVQRLYRGTSIQRRISVYVLSKKFSNDLEFLKNTLDQNLFDDECMHETYHFLNENLKSFDAILQELIINNLLNLYSEDSLDEKILRKLLRWLNSMETSGSSRVFELIKKVRSNKKVGLPANPDFFVYTESSVGPGPTPFSAEEILYFLEQDTLVEKLNGFKGSKDIFSENREALCSEFEVAIKQSPLNFIAKLPSLLELEVPYQYSLANSFANLYARSEVDAALKTLDVMNELSMWVDKISGRLASHLESHLDYDDSPNGLWLISAVADLVKAVSRSDENNFSDFNEEALLNALMQLLKLAPDEENKTLKDPTNFVINSSNGRLLEALILFSLGVCRRRKKLNGNHIDAWVKFEPIFQSELSSGNRNVNLKFLCLLGRYILQFNFMSPSWVSHNLSNIFSPPEKEQLAYVLDGVAYAPSSSALFNWLKETKSLDRGLEELNIDSVARQKLVERLFLAYSWGEEVVNSAFIQRILVDTEQVDLENILKFAWSISNQELEIKQRKLIANFWTASFDSLQSRTYKSSKIADLLLKLICYFDDFDDSTTGKFISLIPISSESGSSYFIVDSLLKLFLVSPENVSKFSAAFLTRYPNTYDYESKWLNLAKLVSQNANCKLSALTIISHMDANPGFKDLYREFN